MRAMETALIVAAIVLPLFAVVVFFEPAIEKWMDLKAADEVRPPSALYTCVVETPNRMMFPSDWVRSEEDAVRACRENDLDPVAVFVWEEGKDQPYQRPPQ